MEYILVARCCSECGGDIAVMPFNEKPTEKEEKMLIDSLGGMYCIQTKLLL